MKAQRTISLLLALGLLDAVFGAAFVLAAGTGTASGQIDTNGTENHCRVGKNDADVPPWGKVEILSVTVLDKFGRAKRPPVTWRIVGGAGSSRPTVKVTPPMDDSDIIQIELKTEKANPATSDGGWGFVGVHCY